MVKKEQDDYHSIHYPTLRLRKPWNNDEQQANFIPGSFTIELMKFVIILLLLIFTPCVTYIMNDPFSEPKLY